MYVMISIAKEKQILVVGVDYQYVIMVNHCIHGVVWRQLFKHLPPKITRSCSEICGCHIGTYRIRISPVDVRFKRHASRCEGLTLRLNTTCMTMTYH